MILQDVIGRIGRKKRHECARFISDQLTEDLASNPTVDSALVVVTSREFLDAFRARRFGRSTREMTGKLTQRIRANLHNQPLLVSAHSTTEHGTVTSLKVTAERISAPRG